MASITTDQYYPSVVLEITDSQGRPAKVEGAPAWASSDETVLKVTPEADGMKASVDTVAIGTARITVSADADLGAGQVALTGVSEDVTVTQGPSSAATTMKLTLGTPTDKP